MPEFELAPGAQKCLNTHQSKAQCCWHRNRKHSCTERNEGPTGSSAVPPSRSAEQTQRSSQTFPGTSSSSSGTAVTVLHTAPHLHCWGKQLTMGTSVLCYTDLRCCCCCPSPTDTQLRARSIPRLQKSPQTSKSMQPRADPAWPAAHCAARWE